MKMPVEESQEAKFAMAPMIDMVFLLLVFFMCASHLSTKQNVPLDMAVASKGVVPKDRPDRWIVNILSDGTLFSGDVPVSLDDLKGLIKGRYAEDPGLKVYLRADANAEHREIKKVMDAMAAVGIDQFIFGVYTPSP